jgi:putative endonuclease
MSLTEKQRIGSLAEDIAVKHLVKQGYHILERNLRKPWGEIDIVAEKKGALVFVEVKALRSSPGAIFRPEDHFNRAKLKRFKRTAELYMQSLKKEVPWQLDLIAIELGVDGLPNEIRHIANIEA